MVFTFDNDMPNRWASADWAAFPWAYSLRSWRTSLAVVRARWLCSPEGALIARDTEAMMAARVLVRRCRTHRRSRQRGVTVSLPGSLPVFCCQA
jgi:hypothetical protein